MKPSVKMNQSRSQSHFDPSKHLRDVIVATQRTVRLSPTPGSAPNDYANVV